LNSLTLFAGSAAAIDVFAPGFGPRFFGDYGAG